MKRTGTYLIITGVLIMLAAWFFFPTDYPVNPFDTEMPGVTITATGDFPWRIFAGAVVVAIGLVFYFAETQKEKQAIN